MVWFGGLDDKEYLPIWFQQVLGVKSPKPAMQTTNWGEAERGGITFLENKSSMGLNEHDPLASGLHPCESKGYDIAPALSGVIMIWPWRTQPPNEKRSKYEVPVKDV